MIYVNRPEGTFRIVFKHEYRKGQLKATTAILYPPSPDKKVAPLGSAKVSAYYKDNISKEGGRLRSLTKLLDAVYHGPEQRPIRAAFWDAYHQRPRV